MTGLDFSARFIGIGTQLAEQGRLRYTLTEEGELVSYRECSLAELGLADVAHKVEFFQGDACNLKPVFSGYDLVLAANLIDRLYNPALFLTTIHERLNPGGLLMLASPYTWLPEHTKREEWVGGFKKDGESFTTLDGLKAMLGATLPIAWRPRVGALRHSRNPAKIPAQLVRSHPLGAHLIAGDRSRRQPFTCRPHSLDSGDSHHQRPARTSSPGAMARVQGAQPMLG